MKSRNVRCWTFSILLVSLRLVVMAGSYWRPISRSVPAPFLNSLHCTEDVMNAIALDARRTLLERRAALANLARELDRDAQEMRETPQGDEADQATHRQPLAVLELMRKGEISKRSA